MSSLTAYRRSSFGKQPPHLPLEWYTIHRQASDLLLDNQQLLVYQN